MGNQTSGPYASLTSLEELASLDAPQQKRQRRSSVTPGTFVRKQEGNFSERYKGISLLGKGSFGRVVLCKDRGTGNEAAVKVMAKKNLKKTDDLALLMREVNMLRSLDHPNIMKIYEFFEDDAHFYVVGEVYRGGELFDEIVRRKKLSELDAKIVMRQVLSGISYLHQKEISHRDMKPENILLEKSNEVDSLKIIDFGLSTITKAKMKERTGTAYYVAPEVLKGRYNEKCDVWSVGVILYILLSGCPPFHGQNETEILKRVENGRYTFRLPQFDKITEAAKNMTRACLLYNPEHRLSAQELLNNPWLIDGSATSDFFAPHVTDTMRHIVKHFDSFATGPRLAQYMAFYIASKLTTLDETNHLKQVFSAIDNDGDGRLSPSEIENAYIKLAEKKMSRKRISRDVKHFMDVMDFDGDGFIDISEFVTIAIDRDSGIRRRERLERGFSLFCPDNTGKITVEHLREVLGDGELNYSQLIRNMDYDNDDVVNWDDFTKAMARL